MIICQLYLIDGPVTTAGGPNDLSTSWLPRSPHLYLMDFLFGVSSNKKFVTETVRMWKILKDMYFLAFKIITKNMLMSTMIYFEKRMEKVVIIKRSHGEL